ncbi:MAG: threonine synthase [Bacteroidota bacterium]
MVYFSTNNTNEIATLKEAVIRGLAPDKGLYMPSAINAFNADFIENISNYSFQEIAFETAKLFFGEDVPTDNLRDLVFEAVNFEAPVVDLDDSLSVLELWHGPTLAFKDFGARFMARMLGYFLKNQDKEVHVLVATSGDTGSAVANGFLGVEGIKVHILYPKGKVSEFQEKQMTTLGQNISALEVDGVFDDCQEMVKKAFLDKELNQRLYLTSANSINIARLFPQSFYYGNAVAQKINEEKPLTFCVPSGNFGNLTSGIFAKRMGMPIHHFIAATNRNNVVPEYINTGAFVPRESVQTISNAMDVGNPSNFARMKSVYGGSHAEMANDISAFYFNDDQTKEAVREIYQRYNYVMDPHGAVAYLAAKEYIQDHKEERVILLETAHPAKFAKVVEEAIEEPIEIPKAQRACLEKEKKSTPITNRFDELKSYLFDL